MRALRAAPVIGFALAISMGAAASAVTPVYDIGETLAIQHVSGSVVLDEPTTRGAFDVADRVYQFRDVPRTGAPLVMSDPRISGQLQSTWNWDVHASGTQPVPAWGTMQIDVPALSTIDREAEDLVSRMSEGAWVGDFTALRHADGEPFEVRAFLLGEGAYEGLCATLDFEAGDMAWLADGVIHPVAMDT